ncbi:hypothetical protein [Streptomyces acidicola]|uniref:hypothetical protein n=1 Tax=Streptomyces acidicola TaxID=2596892 RepID=UPI0038247770
MATCLASSEAAFIATELGAIDLLVNNVGACSSIRLACHDLRWWVLVHWPAEGLSVRPTPAASASFAA